MQIAKYYQVPLENNLQPDEYTIIVDALFGVGLSRPVEGRYAEIIHMLNQSGAFRVAVDIPSGINGDTGREMGIGFRADLTVTFAFCKRGLCFYPGRMYAGELIVADIGIYANPDRDPSMAYLEKKDLSMLPSRIPWGNKGNFRKSASDSRFPRNVRGFLPEQCCGTQSFGRYGEGSDCGGEQDSSSVTASGGYGYL